MSDDAAAPSGLIVLEAVGSNQEIDTLSDELRRLKGIQVQSMFFSIRNDGPRDAGCRGRLVHHARAPRSAAAGMAAATAT